VFSYSSGQLRRRQGPESAQFIREIAGQRLSRVCAVCGESFQGVVQQKNCSSTCANHVYNRREAGECALCGVAFTGHRGQRYCLPSYGAQDRSEVPSSLGDR
jgi:hypothetical protein